MVLIGLGSEYGFGSSPSKMGSSLGPMWIRSGFNPSHLIFEVGFCITLGLGMDLKFGSLNSWSGPGYKLDPLK